MSLSKQVPEGLKNSEVERGNGSFRAPIPYVPERIEDLDPDRKIPTIKVDLTNGVEARQPVWDGRGNREDFLCHMLGMKTAMEGMGLFFRYNDAKARVSIERDAMGDEKDLRDMVNSQIENTVLEADKVPLREEAAKHTLKI